MSLMVSIVAKNDTTYDANQLEALIPPPNNHIFGTEIWRKEVWGHPIIKELGCRLIHSLAEENVYAYDNEVQKLKSEFETILTNIERISDVTNTDKSGIGFRVSNALEVIKIVQQNLEHVGIALW